MDPSFDKAIAVKYRGQHRSATGLEFEQLVAAVNVSVDNLAAAVPTDLVDLPTGFTKGSVIFAGTSGVLTEDNSHFFWDDTNNRLGLGTAAPAIAVHVVGANDAALFRLEAANGYKINFVPSQSSISRISAAIDGATGTALQFTTQTSAGATTAALTIDATQKIGIGTASPATTLHVVGGIHARTTTLTDGYVGLVQGSVTAQGYIEWYKPGTPLRVAYLGFTDLAGSAANIGLNLENAANFIIGGGDVGLGATTPLFGSGAGSRLVFVRGATQPGNIELGTDAADGNNVVAGNVYWSNAGQTGATYKAIGYMYMFTSGTTAGNRGSGMTLAVKADGANTYIPTTIDNAGKWYFSAGAQFGSGSVSLVDATGKIPAISATYFASLSGANLTGIPTTALSGTLQAAQFPALTGDITSSAGSLATAIGASKVTNAMIVNGTIDLAAKVTGVLPVANGGTGASSLAANGILFTNGTTMASSSAFKTDGSQVTDYLATSLAGAGLTSIVASARVTGQTAANGSIATFTVGGSTDASFEVSGLVNVTTSTTHSFRLQVSYTDENSVAVTQDLPLTSPEVGVSTVSSPVYIITNVVGAGVYASSTLHIRCKAGTTVTIKTAAGAAGNFTAVTYNAEGAIKMLRIN